MKYRYIYIYTVKTKFFEAIVHQLLQFRTGAPPCMVAMYSNRKGSSYHYFGGILPISIFLGLTINEY